MKIRYLSLVVIISIVCMVMLPPAFANTEYQVPGDSGIVFGTTENVGLNVSYQNVAPSIGTRVYVDENNETWFISNYQSPDGMIDIVVVPKNMSFLELILSWI